MNITAKKLAIFDLDGTLAPSKSPLQHDMAELIVRLLQVIKVAVISGGGYPQFQTQFLSRVPQHNEGYSNLYLLPTSGTQLYTWKGTWHQEYAEFIPAHDRELIIKALKDALRSTGYTQPAKVFGEVIEDRLSQITFSALGQKAPLELKSAWDPDHKKRQKIVASLQKKISKYDIRIGGTNSIDITLKGVNKAYGIRKLEQYLGVGTDDIVFVGDALFHGGNDFPARATGVDCISVASPAETAELIKKWLRKEAHTLSNLHPLGPLLQLSK
jgi:HAD superfamily hydrolase (TIGR01484 family)